MKLFEFGFELFGFDFMPVENQYGFWLFHFSNYSETATCPTKRNLLGLYYCDGMWSFDIFWIKLFNSY